MMTARANSPEYFIPPQWNVPRGTYEKLLIYIECIAKWNWHINLIAEKELSDLHYFWERHILDSLQLVQYIDADKQMIDVGSGGGLPALILAAAGYKNITAVESDKRKCEFLKEAARLMRVKLNVMNNRVEDVESGPSKIITARAFAPVGELLKLTQHLQQENMEYILLKGRQAERELQEARKNWQFEEQIHASDYGDGVVLRLANIRHK